MKYVPRHSFKDEADFTPYFLYWRHNLNPVPYTEALELKYVKKGPWEIGKWFKAQTHQARGLLQSIGPKGCCHKISDDSRGKKPYDAFIIKDAVAVMPIWFQEHKQFVIVKIEDVMPLTKTCKSVSFETLSQLGEVYSF